MYEHIQVDGTKNYRGVAQGCQEKRWNNLRDTFTAYLTFNKTFKDAHNLNVMAGYDYSKWRKLYLNAKSTGQSSDKVPILDSGTTFIEDTGEVLMSVSFDGTISSLTNLVHEYAHAIGFKNKPTSWRTGAENSFIEIESYLHSILFLDFMDDHGYSADTNYERTAILNTAIESTSVLRKKKFLVTNYNEIVWKLN